MFKANTLLPFFLMAFSAVLGCKTQAEDPVRQAEIFLELSEGATQEHFSSLYKVIAKRICAQDRSVMEDKMEQFTRALPAGLANRLNLHTSDLITGLDFPKNLNLEKGHIIARDGATATVGFPSKSKEKDSPSFTLSMVFEDEGWKACNVLVAEQNNIPPEAGAQ